MRRSTKPYRITAAAVMATVAVATVVTFTRNDDPPAQAAAPGLPHTTSSYVAPTVEAGDTSTEPSADPAGTSDAADPTPSPDDASADERKPAASPSTSAGGTHHQPTPRTSPSSPSPAAPPPPAPSSPPQPAPSPTPTPDGSNLLSDLLDTLLG